MVSIDANLIKQQAKLTHIIIDRIKLTRKLAELERLKAEYMLNIKPGKHWSFMLTQDAVALPRYMGSKVAESKVELVRNHHNILNAFAIRANQFESTSTRKMAGNPIRRNNRSHKNLLLNLWTGLIHSLRALFSPPVRSISYNRPSARKVINIAPSISVKDELAQPASHRKLPANNPNATKASHTPFPEPSGSAKQEKGKYHTDLFVGIYPAKGRNPDNGDVEAPH
ncbi:MAG: hypothetical protein Q7V63_04605 [Gammaproteobacteria bacterium]|nr:hypothetical protein [Gammaproteobacteria bacterium]